MTTSDETDRCPPEAEGGDLQHGDTLELLDIRITLLGSGSEGLLK